MCTDMLAASRVVVVMQAWAYAEDQKITTHPINPESVVDTNGTAADAD